MKIHIFLFIVPVFFGFTLSAQQTYQTVYGYDETGNRTLQHLIIITSMQGQSIFNGDKGILDENYTPTEEYKESIGDAEVVIYPNPTRGKVVVEITGTENAAGSDIVVIDMAGREVLHKSHPDPFTQIDLTGHPDGHYLMIITIGNEKKQWRIVKE